MKIWGTNKIPQKYRDFRASTWIEKLVLKSCSYGNFGHLVQSKLEKFQRAFMKTPQNSSYFSIHVDPLKSIYF